MANAILGYVYEEVSSPSDTNVGYPGPSLPPALPVHVTGSRAFTTTQEGSEGCWCVSWWSQALSFSSSSSTGYSSSRTHPTAVGVRYRLLSEPNSDMPALHILASVASNVNSSPASSTFSANPLLHRDPSAAHLVHSHAGTGREERMQHTPT